MPFERELRRENGIWEVYAQGRWHSVQANFANLHQALQEYTGIASVDALGNQTLMHSDPNKNISVMALTDDVKNNIQRYAYDPRGREENEMLRQQVVAAQGAQLPGPQAGSMGQYIESVGRQYRQDQRSVAEMTGQEAQLDLEDESRWTVEQTAEAQEHMPYWYPGAVQSYIGVSWPEVVRQAAIGRKDRPGEPTIFDEALKYAKSIGATDLPDEVKEPRGPTSGAAYLDQQVATTYQDYDNAIAAGDQEEANRLYAKINRLQMEKQQLARIGEPEEAPRAAPRITLDQAIDDAILSGDTARASELIAARDRAQAGSGMTRSQAIQYAAQFAQTSDEFDRMLAAITQQYAPQQPVGPSPEQLRQQRLADIRQYIQPAPFPGGPPGTGIPTPPLTSAGQAYAQYTAKPDVATQIPSPDDSFYVGATGTPTPEQVTEDPSLDFYAGRQPFDPASQEAFETAGIEKTPFSPGGVPLIPVPAGTEFAEGTAGFKSVYDLSGRPKSQDQLTIDAELAELADLESRHTATSMYVPGETQYATKVIRDPYGRVISTEVGEGDPERSEIIPPLPGYNRRNLTEYGKRALGAEGITMDPVPVIAPGRTVTSLYDNKENPELEKRHNELLQRRRERNNPNLISRAQQQTGAPRFGSANAFEQTIGNIKQGRTQRKLSSQKAGRTFKFGLS